MRVLLITSLLCVPALGQFREGSCSVSYYVSGHDANVEGDLRIVESTGGSLYYELAFDGEHYEGTLSAEDVLGLRTYALVVSTSLGARTTITITTGAWGEDDVCGVAWETDDVVNGVTCLGKGYSRGDLE